MQTMKCGGENILLLMTAMLCGIGLYATPDGVAAQMFDPPPSKQGNALQALYAPSASNLQLSQPRHFCRALNPVTDVAGAMSFCPE